MTSEPWGNSAIRAANASALIRRCYEALTPVGRAIAASRVRRGSVTSRSAGARALNSWCAVCLSECGAQLAALGYDELECRVLDQGSQGGHSAVAGAPLGDAIALVRHSVAP